ncbi:MAG: ribonuclease P protein component [Verrucomicrobiales bacterium]
MSLPRALRITKRREYETIRLQGRRITGRLLVLGVLDDPQVATYKAGFIVPKALGKAVLRNRTKRRLREIVRRRAVALRPHIKVVTLARRQAVEAQFADLEKEWWSLARKAGLLQPDSPAS